MVHNYACVCFPSNVLFEKKKKKRLELQHKLHKEAPHPVLIFATDAIEPMGPGPNEDLELKFDYALRERILDTEGDGDDIHSEDDEEIESDDAFEQSDEEGFAGTLFAKEVDGEEVEGDSDEFLDVLDVLDGRGGGSWGGDDSDEGGDAGGDDDDDDDDDDAEENEEDEDIKDPFAPSDTEHQSDEDALDNLDAFVSNLEYGKKRKAEAEPGDAAVSDGLPPNPKRRMMLKARTEAGVESEFGVHAASG